MPLTVVERPHWVHTKTRAVCFYMRSPVGVWVQCNVTKNALTALARRPVRLNAERELLFRHWRATVERLASDKFDRGPNELIVIDEADVL